jgi:TolB-like protein/DNA-binding winged helix-turn-helix (wHTH) protein/Flp pilus assembly protein TadD
MVSQVQERYLQERYEFGPFRLDPAEHTLLRGDQVVALTPKAFETLALLVRSGGHLVRKEELLERVWRDTIVEEGNLNVIIHTLRKALGDEPRESKYIETVAKCGYRFVAEVRKAGELEETSEVITASLPDNIWKPSSYQQQVAASPLASPSHSPPAHDRRRLVIFGASVLVVAFAATFLFVWRSNHPPKATVAALPAPVRSIAVLPFRVLSSEKGDEYLSLGLADALITSLSQTRQVIVRQTEAVAKYQNTGKDPLEAGREQGVDAVLEGQVQRIGDRVRVTARLVRTSDGTSLWADRFEEKFTNIFAVEDAVAEKVARTTIVAMKGAGEATTERLTKRYTENNEAYEAYLKGRYMWNRRTVDSLQKALSYFQQAIRLDPNYSLAYVGLADTYTLLSFFTLAAPNDAFPKAKVAAEKALTIDSTLVEAYTALGQYKAYYEWDWNGAEDQFQKGIALNPNYPLLHHWRSLNLIAMGRMDEARAAMRRALELDPLLLVTNVNLGRIDYYEGRYDQAIKQYQRALELDKDFMRTHLRLGLAYVQQGRYHEALLEYNKALEIAGDTPQIRAHIAHVMAVSGKKSEALAGLAELQERAKRQYVPPYDIALIYVGLGEKDKAFAWLEKAYNDHSTEMIYFKVEPLLAPLRSDSRYQDLLRRMKLS